MLLRTPVTIVADDPAKYTVQFNADNSLVLRADCNRRRGPCATTADRRLTPGPAAAG